MNPIRHAGNRPVMTSGLACVIALSGNASREVSSCSKGSYQIGSGSK